VYKRKNAPGYFQYACEQERIVYEQERLKKKTKREVI
jgi:hypothetical protein